MATKEELLRRVQEQIITPVEGYDPEVGYTDKYNTPLPMNMQGFYEELKKQVRELEWDKYDYDTMGYVQELYHLTNGDVEQSVRHLKENIFYNERYKKPNHLTFSDESIYAANNKINSKGEDDDTLRDIFEMKSPFRGGIWVDISDRTEMFRRKQFVPSKDNMSHHLTDGNTYDYVTDDIFANVYTPRVYKEIKKQRISNRYEKPEIVISRFEDLEDALD